MLVRSERANLAYYNHLFGLFGLPAVSEDDREPLGLLHTLSTPQVLEVFFPAHQRDRAREAARRVDFSAFLRFMEPEPGWIDVLARLRPPMKVAVATNRGDSAHQVLRAAGLCPHLDFVATIRDGTRPKPHPDLLLAVLANFAVRPENALYVGDSELDREASQAALVPFMGFRTALPPAVSSPEELAAHLWAVAPERDSGSVPPSFLPQPMQGKEIRMSQKDLFHPEDNVLKRGCQVSEGDVELCPCGSGKAFNKCHGAACECGSKKPKYKCCHADEL